MPDNVQDKGEVEVSDKGSDKVVDEVSDNGGADDPSSGRVQIRSTPSATNAANNPNAKRSGKASWPKTCANPSHGNRHSGTPNP